MRYFGLLINSILISILFIPQTQAQYFEAFSVANKGVTGPCTSSAVSSCVSYDVTGVDWTLDGDFSGLDDSGGAEFFKTVNGVMTSFGDIDEEICWLSPVMDISLGGANISLSADVSYTGFDASDFLDVEYKVDGGAWVVVNPNATNHTISGMSGGLTGSQTVTQSGISGSTLQVRVCTDFNATAENFTLDNVSVPNANLSGGPIVDTQPQDQTACEGTAVTFSTSSNNASSYQWQINTGAGFTNLSNGGIYTGVTSSSLNISDVTGLESSVYQCVLTNANGTTNTNPVVVNILYQPQILIQPNSIATCIACTTRFDVVATGEMIQYQWQVDSGSGFTNVIDNATYSGSTTNQLLLTNVPASFDTYIYRVIVSGTCTPQVMSQNAVLSVSGAATTLMPGDLGFIAYNGDGSLTGEDEFAFVLLTDIQAGTSIQFTDIGWSGSNSFESPNIATGDGIINWISTSSMTCGTEINIQCRENLGSNIGIVVGTQASVSNSLYYMSLISGGDQVIAYQGLHSSPNLIAAINMNGPWDNNSTYGSGGNSLSYLPGSLVDGSSSISFIDEQENGRYDCTTSIALPPALGTAIFNSNNWIRNTTQIYPLPLQCNISCTPCGLITFTGETGDWHDPANWDVNKVPTACDDVLIPLGSFVTMDDVNQLSYAKSVLIQGTARLDIKSGNEIFVDNSVANGITVEGILLNDGTINIGANMNIGGKGLQNVGTTENTGTINVDDVALDAVDNINGVFQNFGFIYIGQNKAIGYTGIRSYARFNNVAVIVIDRVGNGIENYASSEFLNTSAGIIGIGANNGIGFKGIYSEGMFTNFGQIEIDNTSTDGIYNNATSQFLNSGILNIGNINQGVQGFGLYNIGSFIGDNFSTTQINGAAAGALHNDFPNNANSFFEIELGSILTTIN